MISNFVVKNDKETKTNLDKLTRTVVTANYSILNQNNYVGKINVNLKIERFFLHNYYFKLAKNWPYFYSRTLLNEKEVELSVFCETYSNACKQFEVCTLVNTKKNEQKKHLVPFLIRQNFEKIINFKT